MDHFDLRTGRHTSVPLHLAHPISKAIHDAAVSAHHGRCYVPVDQTPFQIFSDYAAAEEGNALFAITAAKFMGGGRVSPGSVVYAGVLASERARAPLCWRHILKRYLREVAQAAPLFSYGSVGAMPTKVPWSIGYSAGRSAYLTTDEGNQLMTLVRLLSLDLLARCEAGAKQARAAGENFEPDLEEYFELREEEG